MKASRIFNKQKTIKIMKNLNTETKQEGKEVNDATPEVGGLAVLQLIIAIGALIYGISIFF